MAAGAPGAGLSSAVPLLAEWTVRLLWNRGVKAIWTTAQNVSVTCALARGSFCFVQASFCAEMPDVSYLLSFSWMYVQVRLVLWFCMFSCALSLGSIMLRGSSCIVFIWSWEGCSCWHSINHRWCRVLVWGCQSGCVSDVTVCVWVCVCVVGGGCWYCTTVRFAASVGSVSFWMIT